MNLTDDEARERFIQIVVEIIRRQLCLDNNDKTEEEEPIPENELAGPLSNKTGDNTIVIHQEVK